MSIVLDAGRCVGCGCCIDVCPTGALELDEKAAVNEDDCTGCYDCLEMCPVGAIAK
jgi:energy-converting hydrogenase A subunit Q